MTYGSQFSSYALRDIPLPCSQVVASCFDGAALNFIVASNDFLTLYYGRNGRIKCRYSTKKDLYLQTNPPTHVEAEITAMDIDPIHKRCYLGFTNGLVRVYTISNGNYCKEFDPATSHISCLKYCIDNMAVICSSWDGSLRIYDDTTDGYSRLPFQSSILRELVVNYNSSAYSLSINFMDFSKNFNILIVSYRLNNSDRIYIINYETFKIIYRLVKPPFKDPKDKYKKDHRNMDFKLMDEFNSIDCTCLCVLDPYPVVMIANTFGDVDLYQTPPYSDNSKYILIIYYSTIFYYLFLSFFLSFYLLSHSFFFIYSYFLFIL